MSKEEPQEKGMDLEEVILLLLEEHKAMTAAEMRYQLAQKFPQKQWKKSTLNPTLYRLLRERKVDSSKPHGVPVWKKIP